VNGATPSESAAREAWEEAGATGEIAEVSVGLYSYAKRAGRKGARLPCVVSVFPLRVEDVAKTWPEAKARKRRWVPVAKAVTLVENPELRRILADFDPETVTRPVQSVPLNFPVF
jgi:8-oxo-dGTP pyrophosphatase MutT (NUDIX family)